MNLGMPALTTPPMDLLSRMVRVKRQAMLLFFGGPLSLSVLTLLLPTRNAPDEHLGRLLFLLTILMGGYLSVAIWRWPQLLGNRAFNWQLVLLGNLSTGCAVAGETFLFGSQISMMLVLWPMVAVAAFQDRRMLWWQVGLGALNHFLLAYLKMHFLISGWWWWMDGLVVTVGVTFTGLAIAFFRDAAVAEAQALARMVQLDPLTGLSNRRDLNRKLAALVTSRSPQQRVALIMLDLDHFKTVNDRFGHLVGDEVLVAFARMLEGQAAPGDFVARLGGEEFMWITTAQQESEVLGRVEDLREQFSTSAESRGITVSSGVAFWLGGTEPPLTEMMQQADQALCRAKAGGCNRVALERLDHVHSRHAS